MGNKSIYPSDGVYYFEDGEADEAYEYTINFISSLIGEEEE